MSSPQNISPNTTSEQMVVEPGRVMSWEQMLQEIRHLQQQLYPLAQTLKVMDERMEVLQRQNAMLITKQQPQADDNKTWLVAEEALRLLEVPEPKGGYGKNQKYKLTCAIKDGFLPDTQMTKPRLYKRSEVIDLKQSINRRTYTLRYKN